MKKFSRKEKVNLVKAGVSAYAVSSLIAWLKHGGIEWHNQAGAFVIRIHKTFGVIDVFRLEGRLKDLDVFGGDFIFFFVGMFSSIVAVGIMKLVHYIQSEGPAPSPSPPAKRTIKIRSH